MSELSVQQILSSRFRTSSVADRYTVKLMEGLGLSSKANVARLAIGRSLALGALNLDGIDSKGLEIPASSLFSQDDISVWIGLIVAHALAGGERITTMDAFRAAVRGHWHRGANLLMDDWNSNSEDFDRFLETLINRRAQLPEVGKSRVDGISAPAVSETPQDLSAQLVAALRDIGITADVRDFTHGPRITRYRVFLPDINQLDKLRNGMERLGLVLGLQSALPSISMGDQAKTVFMDIPRPKSTWINYGASHLREWISTTPVDSNQLMVFPGVDVLGQPYSFNLANAPHLLVGGATGQGKSVCLHSMILSLILKHPRDNLRLGLIDPKQVEFMVYENLPHIWGDGVAVGIASARERILDLVHEMDLRYSQFKELGVTNIVEARQKNKNLRIPYIVVFIEELADLVLQDREIEGQIVRLAQLARAAGIHLVLATQRPDAKTFSGLIRSNVPARIALTVQKGSESKIILDDIGAEKLLGAGDMFVKITGAGAIRVHGAYVSRLDIESAIQSIK